MSFTILTICDLAIAAASVWRGSHPLPFTSEQSTSNPTTDEVRLFQAFASQIYRLPQYPTARVAYHILRAIVTVTDHDYRAIHPMYPSDFETLSDEYRQRVNAVVALIRAARITELETCDSTSQQMGLPFQD